MNNETDLISVSPFGEQYHLPSNLENLKEIKEIIKITNEQKKSGRKIIVVQGLGFVGSVMAAIIADAEDSSGNPLFFVHGIDLPFKNTYWKIPTINNAISPIISKDDELASIFQRTIKEKKTLRTTWSEYAYKLCDVVVVDIHLDVKKPVFGDSYKSTCDIEPFKDAIRTISRNIQPETLVLIETTVPPGTCELIVKPILESEFIKRGIDSEKFPPRIGHSYERVMPGKNYIKSIIDFWRSYSGIDEISKNLTKKFLNQIINVDKYPLFCHDTIAASEMAKILENTYRATNIALLYEWTLFAEDIGVDLFKVVDSIRVRKTHRNLMYPGFGVGGYCLTKDTILANWASEKLFNRENNLDMSLNSININDMMPLHTYELIKTALNNEIKGKNILILGVSYLEDVADTRNSPTETLYKVLLDEGANPYVHDPIVNHWIEFPEVEIKKDLFSSFSMMDVIVFAVKHEDYFNLEPEKVLKISKNSPVIIDTWNLINDNKIKRYLSLGCKVFGVGKGHISSLNTN